MTSQKKDSQTAAGQPIRLARASRFSIETLTRAYNQSRVDYLVPMAMDAARLANYIQRYDVHLAHSWTAVDGDEILGLAMLGVRPGRTWITRLGVLPSRRRAGTGEVLLQALLDETRALGRPTAVLEVIQGNQSARQLFKKVGFREQRELVILRRPPGPPPPPVPGLFRQMEKEETFELLRSHPSPLPWTNEVESFMRASCPQGLEVDLGMNGHGWMVYQSEEQFLSHFVLRTLSGDPGQVGGALVAHLFACYPNAGAYLENVPADDEHLPVLQRMGFLEVFRRVEMVLGELSFHQH